MITLKPVKVVETRQEHLRSFWNILEAWPQFWSDKTSVTTFDEFRRWWKNTVIDALTGIDMDSGEIIGAAFIDYIEEPRYATIHIFKKRGYLNPKMVTEIVKKNIPHFFEKYNIEKLVAIFPVFHKATYKLAKRLKFKNDGILRHHMKVNHHWTDYRMMSILRSEVHGISFRWK